MFVAAVIGVDRLLRLDFDQNAKQVSFVALAFAGLEDRLAQWRSEALRAFGRPTTMEVNYSPDFAVRFDLNRVPQSVLERAYRPGEVELLVSGRDVPPGFWAKVSSSAQG